MCTHVLACGFGSGKLLFKHLDFLSSTVKALLSFLRYGNKIRVTKEIKVHVSEKGEINPQIFPSEIFSHKKSNQPHMWY